VIAEVLRGSDVKLVSRRECDHARRMTLEFANGGKLGVTLDQGFGSWRSRGTVFFDGSADASLQARELLRTDVRIEMPPGNSVPLWVTWSDR
jgi:hypothetical protein